MHIYDRSKNKLHEIALVSLVLGSIIGTSLTTVLVCPSKYNRFLVYLIVLSLFHWNEFDCTSRYQQNRVNSQLFLIYGNGGSREFWLVQVITATEFLLQNNRIFTDITKIKPFNHPALHVLGFILIAGGFVFRRLAMKTCGESFSHYIETSSEHPVLVTHGIYLISRHPSYVGFYLIVIGIQLFLNNIVCLVVCAGVLHHFFKKRIRFEEWFLINRIYGQEYQQYRDRTPTLIPFI